MARIDGTTKIAGNFTVDDWKTLRQRLLGEESDNPSFWQEAFAVFQKRIKTRFLNPINRVLSIRRSEGEGFAAAALQCILVEFLEAFYQGKTYTPPKTEEEIKRRAERLKISKEVLEKHLQPNEYNSSAKLFRDFLTGHEPFRNEFTPALANTFYTNVRCGLLHEAATKGATVIKSRQNCSLIQAQPGGDLVLFRTNFQEAIVSFISAYGEELLVSKERKKAFIRKMDDLCQIRRVQYFAYGSNMNLRQMINRVGVIYDKRTGFIRNYAFRYNKRSNNGTSKANIVLVESDLTYGVCFEIDEDAFSKLRGCEKGYSEKEIPFYTNEGNLIIVKTFISSSISDAVPSQEYIDLIIEGAKENDIPEEYINRVLLCRRA